MAHPTLIAFDLDGTLLDFVGCFKRFMAHQHGRHTARTHDDVKNYWTVLSDLYPDLPDAELHGFLDSFFDHEIYTQMEPSHGALEAVAAIRAAFPDARCIGMSSVHDTPEQHRLRSHQLRAFGLDDFMAIGLHASKAPVLKGLGGDLLFDDNPEQIRDAEKLGISAILVSQPWNKDEANIHRLENWSQAIKTIHACFLAAPKR